ncbi:glycosyltransferase [Bacillus thuringiensis]|uniref:glycosyltransferase n=1 Tax=Bacillus thuringiensis TaxID=1428 RepID=UPI002AB3637F|nr:glycosyltransferase [Bacillus thuringiensis]MDY8163762.1 glycosyltransferase [Bacillus thuringiensis]
MKKMLLIPKGQYGYNTDYLKMVNYLSKHNVHVDILCFDNNRLRVNLPENVNVKYINISKNRIINYIKYNIEIIKFILKNRKEYNWIIVSGTIEYCGYIPLLLRKFTSKANWIMDIRTGAVFSSEKKRHFYDNAMKWSTKFFDHITVISDLLAKKLQISKYTLLPLGADRIVDIREKKVNTEKIKFLYVGTFENRNLENVIKAYDIFCTKNDNQIQTSLDVVGSAYTEKYQQRVMEAIENVKNKGNIQYHGRKNHDEIINLFKEAAVGFSYVPITDYYDVQPPTKTYEYIINGIVCIGTNTKANAEIINDRNGILINEDINSIIEGIEKVSKEICKYDILQLSQTVENYEWDKIEYRFHEFLKEIDIK